MQSSEVSTSMRNSPRPSLMSGALSGFELKAWKFTLKTKCFAGDPMRPSPIHMWKYTDCHCSLSLSIIYRYASIIFARLGLHLFADVMARNILKGLDIFQLLIEYEYELYSVHVTCCFLQQALANPTLIFETGQSGKFKKLPCAGQIEHAKSFSYRKLKALLIYIPVRERHHKRHHENYNDGHDTFQIFKLLTDVTAAKHSDIIVTSGPGGSSDAGLGAQLLHLGDKLRLESGWFSFDWVRSEFDEDDCYIFLLLRPPVPWLQVFKPMKLSS